MPYYFPRQSSSASQASQAPNTNAPEPNPATQVNNQCHKEEEKKKEEEQDCLNGLTPQSAALQYAKVARAMNVALIQRASMLGVKDPDRNVRINFAVSRIRIANDCVDVGAISNIYGYLAQSTIDWQTEVSSLIQRVFPNYASHFFLGHKGLQPSLVSGHAETNLYEQYNSPSLKAIGISNYGGPCDGTSSNTNCRLFFTGKNITIGWIDRQNNPNTFP